MNGNVLAALFGGLGAGASSYGASRMREQEQERQAQQRMAELQQQEQMRRTQMQEAQTLRQQERQQINDDMTAALKAMGMDVPQGVTLTPQTTPYITQQQVAKREQERVGRERQGTYNALKQRGVPVGDTFDPNTDYGTVFKDYGREDGQQHAQGMQATALAAKAAADAARAAAQAGRPSGAIGQREDRYADAYNREIGPIRALHDEMTMNASLLPKAVQGDAASQQAVVNAFLRAVDDRSSVKEGEVALTRKAGPLRDRAMGYLQALASNKGFLVPASQLQQMVEVLNLKKTFLEERANDRLAYWQARAKSIGSQDTDVLFQPLSPPRRPNLNKY